MGRMKLEALKCVSHQVENAKPLFRPMRASAFRFNLALTDHTPQGAYEEQNI